jgi:hypothetical protein
MAKDPKKARYSKVSTEGAFDVYEAKPIKIGVDANKEDVKLGFRFRTPTSVSFAGLTPDEEKIYRKLMVEGAWAAEAKNTRLSNDTMVDVNGTKLDMLSLTPRRMARFLNAMVLTLKSQKDANGKLIDMTDTKPFRRLQALAGIAVKRNMVIDNGDAPAQGEEALDYDRFTPAA